MRALDRPRSGQQIAKAKSSHSVKGQLNLEIGTSFPNLLSTFSTMVSGREIISIGEAAALLYDNTSVNGSNGPVPLIVVKPGDQGGPTVEMPGRAFICTLLSSIGM